MINPLQIRDAIYQRHSKRAFLEDPVSTDTIAAILEQAGQAASSKNSQPWMVAVLTNDTLNAVVQAMCKAFDSGGTGTPDYVYMTDPMPDTYLTRARACGHALYELKGIDRRDMHQKNAHIRENYTFFNAPMALIFHMHEHPERGNFLDMGMFIQTVMLGLVAHGLGSCPQYSICNYSDEIRRVLNLHGRVIACGMAVGVPDPSAKVNTFIPPRARCEDYVQWYN